MKKLNGKWIKVIIIVIIAVGGVIFFQQMYVERRVDFADDKMRQVICLALKKDANAQDVTYREIEKIEELRIGPIGEFKTLEDIEKCKNLKVLIINTDFSGEQSDYKIYKKNDIGKMQFSIVEEARILEIEKELEEIFNKVHGIEEFRITNARGNCGISKIEFLKNAKNLKELAICFEDIDDYDALEDCERLEIIDLSESDIDNADVLMKLKKVQKFWLTGTPLAENKEEIQKLREAFPEAEIIID